ncbi:transaldolase [Haloglycomyces albus]|uniref:transaldolase n=1 Tax=Haloglycomyces albus TaxID=526067 RepID=UPI0004A2EBEF|nr:transaldolase [Haloglycomyces albus]
MAANKNLAALSYEGVSVWLDDISRDRLRTGNLASLIAEMSVVGVTSNPIIFAKAISSGDAYEQQLRDLATRNVSVGEAVRTMTATDIRWACDVLRTVYDTTAHVDGRVSLEVDPRFAYDTEATIAEAKYLWWLVDRPNLMIKIPATEEGLPAISAALEAGISVNVTLIFSLERYRDVIDAFMTGLERAKEAGRDVSEIKSVASFFVSRVDSKVDGQLDQIGSDEAKALKGQAAIANARLAYQEYLTAFDTPRWQRLADRGATVQRPLWASTSTKDPSYRSVMYVEDLVAANCVNTMPEATMESFAEEGEVTSGTITPFFTDAADVLLRLENLGIDYHEVVTSLETEGVQKFIDPWVELQDKVQEELDSHRSDK